MKIRATTLRITMTVFLLLMLATASIGFYFAMNYIQKYLQVSDKSTSVQANVSRQEISAIEKKLDDLKTTITKTSDIIISRDSYQSQALVDIKKYAADSGVTLSGDLSFARPSAEVNELLIFSGASLTSPVVVTLNNPVEFSSFIKFIRLIESNLPKMQISNIKITRVDNSDTTITVDPMLIEVYTK